MVSLDAIKNRAKAELLVEESSGHGDPVLWDRSRRLAEIARQLVHIPEAANEAVDSVAVVAAAFYHDAGWAVQLRRKEVTWSDVLVRPTNDRQRELAIGRLGEFLGGLLAKSSLEKTAAILRQCGRRGAELLEARILCDAVNLDDVGPQTLWLMVRRHVLEGRGVEALLRAWDRQREYHFWEARLEEGFNFATTRRLAQIRLEAMEQCVTRLRRCHFGEDIGDVLREQATWASKPQRS